MRFWDPNSPPFHHDLAMIYSVTGQTKLAIGKMRDAIRLAPKHAEYHYDLGLALGSVEGRALVLGHDGGEEHQEAELKVATLNLDESDASLGKAGPKEAALSN